MNSRNGGLAAELQLARYENQNVRKIHTPRFQAV
jgi:hypothetical protein